MGAIVRYVKTNDLTVCLDALPISHVIWTAAIVRLLYWIADAVRQYYCVRCYERWLLNLDFVTSDRTKEKTNMKVYMIVLGFACGGILSAASAPLASAQELVIKHPSGGDMGATRNTSGEYDLLIKGKCNSGDFYINRRSQSRFEAHFKQNVRMVQRSNGAFVCSW
jgi:hypothetical protein